MSEKPNLQLGDPPVKLSRRQQSSRALRTMAVLQIVTIIAIGMLLFGRAPIQYSSPTHPERLEELRGAAMALEDRSLAAEAAAAWREYLQGAPDAEDRANVLYRVGGLLMDAEDFSGAAAALVQAEQLAASDSELRSKIGPRIVTCLRRLGKYGEVGRELSRQVEVGGDETAQGKVLATFAGETFTEADLDRMIERTVDRVLAMQSGSIPVSREQMLKQYGSGEARKQMLQEILQRELFSRRARELEMDRDRTFQQTREFIETDLLAGQFLVHELGDIKPTDVDIESFYEAQKAIYRQPETASVVVLPIQKEQAVADLLSTITSADDFRKLAAELAGESSPDSFRITRGQPHPRLGDTTPLLELSAGEWTQTPVTAGDEQLLVLLESKSPATTPPLDQIRFRVESDYRRRKQQELTQKLSADLMKRYDVQILAEPDGVASDEMMDESTDGEDEDRNE